MCYIPIFYHNPSLGLTTKARACKSAGHEGSQGVMSHALGSARKCEGIDPHTPKGNCYFGSWTPDGLSNVQRMIVGSKPNGLRSYLYHWKAIET